MVYAELCGSIDLGSKREQVTVQIAQNELHTVIVQSYYDGTKESEKPILGDNQAVYMQRFSDRQYHLVKLNDFNREFQEWIRLRDVSKK